MKYENIYRIDFFFTKNGNFVFDPIFICIWAEIPLYLKYGESRVDLISKVKFFAFSHYTIPTELHSIGKIWLAGNLVFLTHPNEGIRHFLAKLREVATHCDFRVRCSCTQDVSYADNVIRFRLVAGLIDEVIKEDVLGTADHDLEATGKICTARNKRSLWSKV